MDDDSNEPTIDWGSDDDVATAVPPPEQEEEESGPLAVDLPAMGSGFSEEDFDDNDDEPFDRPDAQKFGIVGGKGVGKSYLFQAMVYRTLSGQQSGALTYYLERDSMRLFAATGNTEMAQ